MNVTPFAVWTVRDPDATQYNDRITVGNFGVPVVIGSESLCKVVRAIACEDGPAITWENADGLFSVRGIDHQIRGQGIEPSKLTV